MSAWVSSSLATAVLTNLFFSRCAEVVLAVLLSTFRFELSDKSIYWNLAGVVYPSVQKEGSEAEMPMKVTLLKSIGIGSRS